MEVEFTEKAREDFLSLEKELQSYFKKHLEKISEMPPRRHLKFGLPFCVESVTKQARLVYEIENKKLYAIRCFALHKDYEKWYMSYK